MAEKTQNPRMVMPEARANYAYLTKARESDEPGKEGSYSVMLAYDKDTSDMSDFKKAILVAARNKWGDKALDGLKKGFIASPLRDGDGMESEEFHGMWIVNARRKESLGPPGLVDAAVQPITDPTEIYSGMFCNVSVSLFAYEHTGKKGVGVGLNNVRKIRDGERIGGKPDPKSEFEPLAGAKRKGAAKAVDEGDNDDDWDA